MGLKHYSSSEQILLLPFSSYQNPRRDGRGQRMLELRTLGAVAPGAHHLVGVALAFVGCSRRPLFKSQARPNDFATSCCEALRHGPILKSGQSAGAGHHDVATAQANTAA